MEFNVKRLDSFVSSESKKKKLDLTPEEIQFMANIFNTIINSDNQDTIIDYLAGIHEMSISDIKYIRNVYYHYLADQDEKKIYYEKRQLIKKENRKRGFIDLSAIISTTIFLVCTGITLAVILYNLL